MSSTFFMSPLANRINEPLVKLDDVLGDVGGGRSGSGVETARRSFFGDGSALLLFILLLLLLRIVVVTTTTGVDGGGGGNILC